jgi:hypothetical protein
MNNISSDFLSISSYQPVSSLSTYLHRLNFTTLLHLSLHAMIASDPLDSRHWITTRPRISHEPVPTSRTHPFSSVSCYGVSLFTSVSRHFFFYAQHCVHTPLQDVGQRIRSQSVASKTRNLLSLNEEKIDEDTTRSILLKLSRHALHPSPKHTWHKCCCSDQG